MIGTVGIAVVVFVIGEIDVFGFVAIGIVTIGNVAIEIWFDSNVGVIVVIERLEFFYNYNTIHKLCNMKNTYLEYFDLYL